MFGQGSDTHKGSADQQIGNISQERVGWRENRRDRAGFEGNVEWEDQFEGRFGSFSQSHSSVPCRFKLRYLPILKPQSIATCRIRYRSLTEVTDHSFPFPRQPHDVRIQSDRLELPSNLRRTTPAPISHTSTRNVHSSTQQSCHHSHRRSRNAESRRNSDRLGSSSHGRSRHFVLKQTSLG